MTQTKPAHAFTLQIDLADGTQTYGMLGPARALALLDEWAAEEYPARIVDALTGRPATRADVEAAAR